jgi:hypothetical protein
VHRSDLALCAQRGTPGRVWGAEHKGAGGQPAPRVGACEHGLHGWSAKNGRCSSRGRHRRRVPEEDGDKDAEWRGELVVRCSTLRSFIKLLVGVIDFGTVVVGTGVVAALKQLPALIGRKKIDASQVTRDLVTGSWRRLVFADPGARRRRGQGGVLVLLPPAVPCATTADGERKAQWVT